MAHHKHLLYMLKNNQGIANKLLEDINEEESLTQTSERFNHIRWLTGHLVYSNSYVLSLLGDESENYKDFEKLFGMGSKLTDDTSAYPSMKSLRERLNLIHEKAIKAIEKASDADLEREVDEGELKSPLWQKVAFFSMHEAYHAGQIVIVRKAIGRENPFG